MIDEELVGQLLAAMTSMQTTIAQQTSQINYLAGEVRDLKSIIERLPCNICGIEHDTNPEHLEAGRLKLRSISDDEPDSVVTRQLDVRASKSGIEVKGPSIMVVALGFVLAIGIVAWTWLKNLSH